MSSLGPYSVTYDPSGRAARGAETAQLGEGTEGVLSKLKEQTPPSSSQGSGFSTKGPSGMEHEHRGAGSLSQQEPTARASSWSHLPSTLFPKLQASGSTREGGKQPEQTIAPSFPSLAFETYSFCLNNSIGIRFSAELGVITMGLA